jgi:3-oxoacyl-[acyl-carrier protein] reductase
MGCTLAARGDTTMEGARMDLGIRGRRALLLGASAGLGRAIAERLAAEGCDVAVSARRGDVLEAFAAELSARHGIRAVGLPADLADPTAPGRLATAAVDALGRIDIVVLNGGGPPQVAPDATDPAGWAAAFQLLATSQIEIATALLPAMRQRGWGRVVAVLSYALRQPIEDLAYSTAGRAAFVAWLKTVSRTVAADGVTVNGALPGRHETARVEQLERTTAARTGRSMEDVRAAHLATVPARRYGRPDEFAAYVAWLCSEPAAYQTGTFTAIDGGLIVGLP